MVDNYANSVTGKEILLKLSINPDSANWTLEEWISKFQSEFKKATQEISFDNLIKDGELTHDYREIKPYWIKRLEGKTYDVVEFYHRFKKEIPPMRFKFEWIKKGRLVNYNMDAYIIKFGERVE